MEHLTEDELIERYYGEVTPRSAQHFEHCRACEDAYAALAADLHEMGTVEAPARDEQYGERVWQELSPSLAAYPVRKRQRRTQLLWLAWSATAACAVLVAAGFLAGRAWEHRQPRTMVATRPAAPQNHVVVVVLSDHLDRTERLLVELKHADADDGDTLSPLRDEARKLLSANHDFRQDAEASGDPALRKALDRLDHVLSELANQHGEWNAAEMNDLRRETDTDGLLLEVRVLRSRIPDGQSKPSIRLKGGAA